MPDLASAPTKVACEGASRTLRKVWRVNAATIGRAFGKFHEQASSASRASFDLAGYREGDARVLRVRDDFSIGSPVVSVKVQSDCLEPWLHDGDVVWFDLTSRIVRPYDLVGLRFAPVSASGNGFVKVMRTFRGRWCLVSNEPPIAWREELVVVGVVVAYAHFHEPTKRPAAMQSWLDEQRLSADAIGYTWSESYLRKQFHQNS